MILFVHNEISIKMPSQTKWIVRARQLTKNESGDLIIIVIQYGGKNHDKKVSQLSANRSVKANRTKVFNPLAKVSPFTLSSAPE
jgi:hypothetical protein